MQSEYLLSRNIEILKKNASRYGTVFKCKDVFDESCKILISKTGKPVAKVLDERNRWQTLHSTIDPEKEAQKLTQNAEVSEEKINVILGCGLGYHVKRLCSNTGKSPFIIVERNSSLLKEFLSFIDIETLECRDNIVVVSAEKPEEATEIISTFQLKNRLSGFSVFKHPASFRAYPQFYNTIECSLQSANSFNIKDRLRYKKFSGEKARILILNSQYFLLGEIINTLNSLGHELKTIFVQPEGYGNERAISSLISEIINFKPDFVLTVNHTGIDREGILCRFFTDIEMPYSSWFVDSPLFILENFETNISDYLCCFLWDKDYEQALKEMGYANCYYLPLATDPTFFKKVPINLNPYFTCLMDVGFVGSSMDHSISKHYDAISNDVAIIDFLNNLSHKFVSSHIHNVKDFILQLSNEEKRLYHDLKKGIFEGIDTALTWKSTQIYRLKCIKEIEPFSPHIFGDHAWKLYLNGTSQLHSEVNYYEELPFVYNATKVNFNATSLQMKGAVNQRVFDVPATGGFVISDYRKQMEELYEIGTEAVCYHDPIEIKDLVGFYLKNDTARQVVTEKAYNRTINSHTYKHRLNKVISTMRRLYSG